MIDLLILATAPAVFLFFFLWARDRYEPEPLHLLLWIFVLGALSTIPAILLEMPFPDGVFTSSVVAPVVEEGLKFLVVFLFIYRHEEFDEPVDGIMYAMAASLGFATVENIFYVLDGGLAVGILRAIMSVPGHVIFSCIWGAALGIAKFRPEHTRAGIILTGLAGAMLLHGIFNFSLDVLEIYGFLLVLLVIIPLGWWMTMKNIRSAHADPASCCSAAARGTAAGFVATENLMTGMTPAGPPRENDRDGTDVLHSEGLPGAQQRFCTDCGARIRDGLHFCENCGKKV